MRPLAKAFRNLGVWKAAALAGGWKATQAEMLGKEMLFAVRLSTHRGRPLGSDSFLSKIARLVGRRLRPLPAGRPRNTRARRKEDRPGLPSGKQVTVPDFSGLAGGGTRRP